MDQDLAKKHISLLSKFWKCSNDETVSVLMHGIFQDWTSEWDVKVLNKAFDVNKNLLIEKEALNQIQLEKLKKIDVDYHEKIGKQVDKIMNKCEKELKEKTQRKGR